MTSQKSVKFISIILLVLLFVQYVLGMLINLFVKLDDVHIPGNSFFEITGFAFGYARTSGGTLEAHWLTAVVLLLLTIILLVAGIKRYEPWLWRHALSLLIWFVIAAFSGAAFVGYRNDYFSLAMAIAFLAAFGTSISLCFRVFQQ